MNTTIGIDIRQEVLNADVRIRPYVAETPVEHSIYLSNLIEGTVHLKLDLQQKTGSFKYRGATNKVMSLSEEELDRGVISASTGNHALAIGAAMKNIGREATIYLAEDVPQGRVDLIRSFGLNLVIYGKEAGFAESKARQVAEEEGKVYISPYNDYTVMAGQGTCGLEISRQVPDVDSVIISCGGGGLIGASAGYLKSFNSDLEVIGVCPENSPNMPESIKAGKIIKMDPLPTLADTCAGNLEDNSVTFEVCKKYVDRYDVLTEKEIADAMRLIFEEHRMVVEGSAAMGVAHLVKRKKDYKGKCVVIVICGKNIAADTYRSVICKK
jgi:threonine dehydratase